MKINRAEIHGFGTFGKGSDFEFSDKFNLVYGSNEAGKSTLLSYIISMLFGMKKEGTQRRSWEEEHAKYKPWNGLDYGGKLSFKLDNEQVITIYRELGEDSDSIQLYDEITGKDITGEFKFDKNRELNFPRELFGMSRALFTNSVCLRQLQAGIGEADAKTVASQVQAVMSTGGGDMTIAKALKIIDSEIKNNLGRGDSGKNKVIGRLKQRVAELKDSLTNTVEKQELLAGLRAEHRRLDSKLQDAKNKLAGYRSYLLAGWIDEREKKLARLEMLEEENTLLHKMIDENKNLAKFDSSHKDDVIRLNTEKKSLLGRENKLKEEDEELDRELSSINADLKELRHFSRVSREELDQFSLLERRWNDLKEDVQARERKLKAEEYASDQDTLQINRLAGVFSKFPQHIDQLYLQWDKRLAELMSSVSLENAKISSARKTIIRWSISLGLGIIACLSIAGLSYFNAFFGGSGSIPAGSFLALGILGAVLLFLRLRRSKSEIIELKTGLENINSEIEKIQSKVDELLTGTASENGEVFLARFNTYLKSVSGRDAAKREQIREELGRSKNKLKEIEAEIIVLLDKAFPGIRADKISSELTEKYVRDGRVFLDVQDKEFALSTRKGKVTLEFRSLEEQSSSIDKKLNEIFKKNNVKDADEYLTVCGKHLELQDAEDALERNLDEMDSIISDRTPEDLKDELSSWKHEAESLSGKGSSDEEWDIKARAKAETLQKEQDHLLSELGILDGKMEKLEEETADRDMLESELEKVSTELKAYQDYRESLVIAMNTLDYVSHRIHRDVAPKLSDLAGGMISIITSGKYSKLKIDENLNIRVVDENNPVPVSVESLSLGTKDQVYLALRLALSRVFSSSGETLPIILDDSLTQYDDQRAEEAIKALGLVADEYQVIMFTCHERDLQIFNEHIKRKPDARLIEL
ncbi:MAG: AAA family ATPase [Acidobacteria bacterium]|nr:AAA family ATPase [Acidobacteriota bacterium]